MLDLAQILRQLAAISACFIDALTDLLEGS